MSLAGKMNHPHPKKDNQWQPRQTQDPFADVKTIGIVLVAGVAFGIWSIFKAFKS